MAEERFRIWNFRNSIQVKYTNASGMPQMFSKDQHELLKEIQDLVKSYQDMNMRLTNRQLYYRLVAAASIPNADKVYKRTCKFLTDARYGGMIDWDAIEDRGRIPKRPSQWPDISALIRSAVYSYRLPRWNSQKYHVELYCEKQALESVLQPVADKYHIYFGCNKGYSSASTMYELAKRLKEQIRRKDKKIVVLYLGDHDPSGLDMVRDIRDRITEFLTGGTNPVDIDDVDFEVVQVALNKEQIDEYLPPPNPAKITDPRAKWYISEHGEVSWELDALPPEVLIRLTTDAILRYIDIEKYKSYIRLEDKQKQALVDFGESLGDGGEDGDDDDGKEDD